jgi:UDP-glucose 4-epimerase
MNILLTGGTGYIGSHSAATLLEAGHNITLFDNLSNSQYDVVSRLTKITNQAMTFIEGDVRDTELLSTTIKKQSIDIVIHFAGLKAVAESVCDPMKYFDNNVGGTISLIDAMKATKIKKIIFSSSATVYGDPKYLPFDEQHPTNAINPYGRTKLHIEEMLFDLAKSDSDWSVVCLRYFNPIGAHPSLLIGDSPSGEPANLVPYITQVIFKQRKLLNIFGGDYDTFDGTGVRDYIHILDLADGHLAAVKYMLNQKGFDIFNLGTGAGFSVLEILREFENISGRNIPYQVTSRREGDVAISYASPAKANKLLDWKAKRNLNEMCSSSLWFGEMLDKNKNSFHS